MAPSQDASEHQDDITFSVGDPCKPSFSTGILGRSHTQSIGIKATYGTGIHTGQPRRFKEV